MSRESKREMPGKERRWGWIRFAVGLLVVGMIGVGLVKGENNTAESVSRDFTPTLTISEATPSSVKALTDRAFWGAPPPMPHSFAMEWDSKTCLNCHAKENNIAKRQQAISPIPHAFLSQCQQCHVRADQDAPLFVLSSFIGTGFPGKGSRATPLAPPTIPHQTFMREHCVSCHGPAGEQRIETPHPYRSQCRQCHVSQIDREYSRSALR